MRRSIARRADASSHGVAVRAQRLQRGQAAERREVHDAVGADVEYA